MVVGPTRGAEGGGWELGRFVAEVRRALAGSVEPEFGGEFAASIERPPQTPSPTARHGWRLMPDREGHVEVPVSYRNRDGFALSTWRFGLFTAPVRAPTDATTMSFERGPAGASK